jgi:hypothetical protein
VKKELTHGVQRLYVTLLLLNGLEKDEAVEGQGATGETGV